MKLTQKKIAHEIGITQQAVSKIVNGSTPLWSTAKKLAEVVPHTTPSFWMDSSPSERKAALKKAA